MFRIEVQAEATVGGIFMYDRCIFNIRVYTPTTTTVITPVQSSTAPLRLSSFPSITRTETIAPSTSDIPLGTESSFSTFVVYVSSINPSSHVKSSQTPTVTLKASAKPSEPTYNGKLPT